MSWQVEQTNPETVSVTLVTNHMWISSELFVPKRRKKISEVAGLRLSTIPSGDISIASTNMASSRAAKRRRLSPFSDDSDSTSLAPNGSTNKQSYDDWELEQDYERRPRKLNRGKENTRLPIKTAEGIKHVVVPETPAEDSDSSDSDHGDGENGKEESSSKASSYDAHQKVPLKQQIIQTKEELANIAILINEDPEEHVGLFKRLADLVNGDTHPIIKKLALASQAAIFKDVIPGYRIRPLSEEEKSTKLSKEVRKLRNYEQSLLSAYKRYVEQLANFARGSKHDDQDDAGIQSVAVNCVCSLLLAVPHFNFRPELLKVLVDRLSKRRVDANFVKCRETLEEIFQKDDDGIVSLEAVRLLSKMMKARNFKVHESVLDTFLHLRLLSELSVKASRDRVDKDPESTTFKGKKMKQKREFRTKKERKLERERKAVEKDMKEADALVSHEEREKNQAETLKLLFGIYFRILKQRDSKLMGAVLEGLAKFAHLINQDFFGDFLEVLKELVTRLEAEDSIEDGDGVDGDDGGGNDDGEIIPLRSSTRQVLLCTITAFALLEGQDVSKAASSLHLDLTFFITHLYRSLFPLSVNPDIEYHPGKSLRLPDPHASNDADGDNKNAENPEVKKKSRVNFQTPTVLLLRCLQSALLNRSHGPPPPLRVAGFSKRLMTTALHLPEKSSIAMLSLLSRVAKQHGRKIASLWHTEERKGDGVFDPFAGNVEGSNVFASTVWEGELLRLHYCPKVRDAARELEQGIIAAR